MARDGRFYEARYPEVDDVVMVQARMPPAGVRSRGSPQTLRRSGSCETKTHSDLAACRSCCRLARRAACHSADALLVATRPQVKSIAEMGAYVSLLEYNNIEGMILLSELSRRRIRSVTKLIKARRGAATRCIPACCRIGHAGCRLACGAHAHAPQP
jgi:hypothetical protein